MGLDLTHVSMCVSNHVKSPMLSWTGAKDTDFILSAFL